MALTGKMTRRGQITVPEEIRNALHLEEGSVFQFEIQGGRISVTPLALVPQDQAWFWTREHQAKEKEADEDLKKKRYRDFSSADSLIQDSRRGTKRKKA